MSFIERALEQMRQEAAAAGTDQADPAVRPIKQPAERRVDTPQRVDLSIQSNRCRAAAIAR